MAPFPASPSPSFTTTRSSTFGGFGAARGRQAGRRSTPTPSSRSPRCRSRSPRRSSRRSSAKASSTGTSAIADLDPGLPALDDPYPTRRAHPARPVLPSQRPARHRRRRSRGHRLRPRRDHAPAAPRAASSSFRAGYSYSNFGLTEGGVAAARPTGKAWEDDRRRAALPAARHDLDQLAPRRLPGARQPRRAARPARRRLGGQGRRAIPTRRRRPAASARPRATSPSGCAWSSARQLSTASRSIAPAALAATHVAADRARRQPGHRRRLASTASAGTSSSAGTASAGATPAPSALGARTLVTLYPDAKLGIVVLTNAFPTGVPEGLADSFFDLVFDGAPSARTGCRPGMPFSRASSARSSPLRRPPMRGRPTRLRRRCPSSAMPGATRTTISARRRSPAPAMG